MSLYCVDLKKMNKDGDLIVIFTLWILNGHFLSLAYSCSCLLTPLPCLNSSLLHLLTRSTLSPSVAVVMEMPQTSWGISEQNSGVQGLVRWVSVGVGSQWGLSFYRPLWRQNLLGKAIKPAALCVFECRLVGQCWPFNLTKLKEMTSSKCFQGCRFSVFLLISFAHSDSENTGWGRLTVRRERQWQIWWCFCKAYGLTKVTETRGRITPKSQTHQRKLFWI